MKMFVAKKTLNGVRSLFLLLLFSLLASSYPSIFMGYSIVVLEAKQSLLMLCFSRLQFLKQAMPVENLRLLAKSSPIELGSIDFPVTDCDGVIMSFFFYTF